ncbi:MAG: cation:proton antiporter [Xanthomonadales bacterium]|nr:cation:proton antiporter [Xanthomonadales bacterium]
MAVEGTGGELVQVVALLGAAVVMVPIFRRIGLGSVLGYLAAGLVIGPFGLGWFADPAAILHVAELGVVMFLFIVGLEMQPSHLWKLRREIFGLGSLQIAACALGLTAVGLAFGFSLPVSFIGAMGFVLTSTAIVMQLLEERGDIALPRGQKIVSILLYEDLLIVPLLAIVAFLSPVHVETGQSRWISIGIGIAALAGLIVAGLWLLNPLFRILARAKAREVMTAAALLVVLGSALLMQVGGLSMAMGAFLAGVLLSESTFRHQLEADVEPFRGILLGLFFLAVGMSLDLAVVARDWPLIVGGVLALMAAKALCIYVVARLTRSSHAEAIDRAVLMAQGGEFAFVLFSAAATAGVIDATVNANLTAIVVLSMALTPLAMLGLRLLSSRQGPSMDGVESAHDLEGAVLIIGFGRFGQVASQSLLARGFDIAIIDTDTDMIRAAAEFGFKIYYGDGARLDVLHASGADRARLIAVCVDDRKAANRIVELVRHEFAQAKVLVRAFDREHAVELVGLGVDGLVRETFESAMAFGEAALRELGVDADDAAETSAEVRRRDTERFELDVAGGLAAGRHLLLGNAPKPTPFTTPTRRSRALSEETAKVTQGGPP